MIVGLFKFENQELKIYTDGKVKEGEIYNVKWGTSEASSSDAVIIASGDYISMAARARMEKEDKHNSRRTMTLPSVTKRTTKSDCSRVRLLRDILQWCVFNSD
jgi:transketolase